MNSVGSGFLVLGAVLSGLAALAHIGIIIGGPAWYRFFGAGDNMARLASEGSWHPALVTAAIALVLSILSAYALSGAGLLPGLPFLSLVLIAVTTIYLLRGIVGFFFAFFATGGNSPTFWVVSSTICLFFGVVHAIGIVKSWAILSGAGS
ncbi:hypothetical protein [Nitrincola sp. MINF-07-Sa-05]|uniref:hypothetical protein n=1 Tax=Nitrincola salilacus TaxID=3400273 RepID=UPI0039185B86